MPLEPSLRWAEVWPLLRDTLPYTIAVALNVVYFRVTILVMSIKATELQTGYFATSFRVVEVLIGIPALVVGAAYPILARAERDDDDRFVYAMRRILELALMLGTWMAMCCVVGAPVAIKVLAGADGEPAIDVLRIQGVTLVSTGVAVACGYGLLTLRRYRAMMLMNVAALIGSVVLTLALVDPLGAQGAAVATVGAETVLAIGVLGVLVRQRPPLAGGVSAAPLILGLGGAGRGAGVADRGALAGGAGGRQRGVRRRPAGATPVPAGDPRRAASRSPRVARWRTRRRAARRRTARPRSIRRRRRGRRPGRWRRRRRGRSCS